MNTYMIVEADLDNSGASGGKHIPKAVDSNYSAAQL